MGLKAKIEAVIYAAEEPITLEQISLLVKDIVLAEEAVKRRAIPSRKASRLENLRLRRRTRRRPASGGERAKRADCRGRPSNGTAVSAADEFAEDISGSKGHFRSGRDTVEMAIEAGTWPEPADVAAASAAGKRFRAIPERRKHPQTRQSRGCARKASQCGPSWKS